MTAERSAAELAAAELLERLAIGETGARREQIVNRLARHRDDPYPEAYSVAMGAAHTRLDTLRQAYNAAHVLGIELTR